jgi:hypothetical protein
MIKADVAGMLNTRGSKMAIVPVGPNPGRTPIMVPTRQPKNATIILRGVKATLRPKMI